MVDTPRAGSEKANMRRALTSTLTGLALVAALAVPAPALAEKVYGAVIVDGARRIEPGRYRSPQDYERTLRFFRRVYGRSEGIVFTRMKTTPKVKGTHIANLRDKRTWDGINVYEVRDKVFIYVLKAGERATKKK